MKFFDFHHHDPSRAFGIYNLKLEEDAPEHFFSAGIHPDSISDDFENHLLWLNDVSLAKNCVAIGECGLDQLIAVDEKLQEEVFSRQILLANQLKKPIIIHCVKKFDRMPAFKKLAKVPMIIHGFNKRKTIGNELFKNDFHLSFGRSVLYNVNLQEFLKDFPRGKIFLESDSAELEMQELYEKVASLKNINVDDLTHIIKKNLQNLNILI